MKKIILAIMIVMIAGNAWGMEKTYAIFDEELSWVHDQDNFIARIKSAGFNTAVICVQHGWGVRWFSSTLPTEFDIREIERPQVDPLRSFIEKARAQGIKTWLWFCVSLRNNYDTYGLMWPYTDHYRFNLADEGYRQHITTCILEGATYGPDGIFLDHIRTGVAGFPNFAWVVESLVVKIHDAVKAYDPKILISAWGHEDGGGDEGGNPSRWLNLGIIDVWVRGVYEDRITQSTLSQIYAATSKPNQVMIVADNYKPDPSSGLQVMQRMTDIGQQPMKGLYWYKSFTDDQVNYLRWYSRWWK